jgi:hypothetical protein
MLRWKGAGETTRPRFIIRHLARHHYSQIFNQFGGPGPLKQEQQLRKESSSVIMKGNSDSERRDEVASQIHSHAEFGKPEFWIIRIHGKVEARAILHSKPQSTVVLPTMTGSLPALEANTAVEGDRKRPVHGPRIYHIRSFIMLRFKLVLKFR